MKLQNNCTELNIFNYSRYVITAEIDNSDLKVYQTWQNKGFVKVSSKIKAGERRT